MATEKILNTRIQLKYDTLTAWQSSAFNGTDSTKWLKSGEVAIVTLAPEFETEHPETGKDAGQHPLLFKVGTGAHKFDDLPWASALAADVYTWAKQSLEEFTAWVAKTPKTVTLKVNNVETDYSIEDAIKLVRNEITAGGEAAAITITDESTDGKIKYTANQGGTAIVESIEINEGTGIQIAVKNNVPEIAHQAKPTTGNAETATAGTGRTYVTEVLVDELGHIAGVKTATETDDGVLDVEGKDAIEVSDKANVTGVKVVGLKLDTANAGNVVLEQSTTGLKASVDLSEYRKIADDEDTKYGIIYDSATRKITLTNDATQTEIDASDFIKDGMIVSVEVVNEDDQKKQGRFLEIVWNTATLDDDNVTTYVDLSDLIDVYTADEASLTLSNNEFSIKNAGVTTAKIADKNVTEEKLADSVAAKLNKEWQPVGNYKVEQEAYSASGSNIKTLTKIEQNANGEITATFEDIDLPEVNNGVLTINTESDVLTGSGTFSANQADATTINIAVAAKGIGTTKIADKAITTDKVADNAIGAAQLKSVQGYTGDDAEVWVFCCGTSTELV